MSARPPALWSRPAVTALFAALLAAVVSPLAAQQNADTVVTDTTALEATAADAPLPGPQLPPYVQSVRPVDAQVAERSVAPMAAAGQHTIVISTLALVLAVVIIVLLVT